MAVEPEHKDDYELLTILDDETSSWLIRGGVLGALGMGATLRKALTRAREMLAEGQSPTAIIQQSPNNPILIEIDQIGRLWRLTGLLPRSK